MQSSCPGAKDIVSRRGLIERMMEIEKVLHLGLGCMQGVASMLMGFHLTTLEEALQPRNPRTGHTWDFPPSIFLRTLSDEDSVIERVNRTLDALQAQATPCLQSQLLHTVYMLYYQTNPLWQRNLCMETCPIQQRRCNTCKREVP